MGTSAAQRSPATPEWERVRELYRQPNPDPGQVVGTIVQALDAETRAQMSGPGVAVCLDTLLVGSRQVSQEGLPQYLKSLEVAEAGPPVLSLASGLRSASATRIALAHATSRFAELALDALAVTAMEAAAGDQAGGLLNLDAATVEANFGGYASQGCLWQLSRAFLGHDLDRTFRYFVSRDLSDFVGTSSFPNVSAAQRFLDGVGHHCRNTTSVLDLAPSEPWLQEVLAAPEAGRLAAVQEFLGQMMTQGLGLLGAGGTL
ncbi:MAG: hypothetical protein N2512_10145 [Armatimonadetes bacterium]|nr:hypothetical protein [Armatimonadota bacterium]